MVETYYIYAQKVGTKSFSGKPIRVHAENGIVCYGCHEGENVKNRVETIIKDLQESEAYSRIAIKDDSMKGYIYNWRMESKNLNVRQKNRAEYMQKRNELKAQIEELKAQLKALDEEWYS